MLRRARSGEGAGPTPTPAPTPAGAFVERLSPPTLTRGKTTRLTLVGSGMAGANGLWTSLPAGEVEAKLAGTSSAGEAVFDVTVKPGAPVGLYGLRLATRSGISNAKIFLIDDLPTAEEREADAPSSPAQPLAWPLAVLGRASDADVDRYEIAVEAGQRVSFEVVGNRLGQDFDPVVVVKDARGRRVAERDNDVGLMFDCRFAHTFEKAGKYTVEVADTRFKGSEHVAYVLRVGRFPEGRVALPSTARPGESVALSVPGEETFSQKLEAPASGRAPGGFFQEVRRSGDQAPSWVSMQTSPYASVIESEPNDAFDRATPAELPRVLHGAIGSPDDRDVFAFELQAGERVSAVVECRPLGSPADLDVAVLDPAGKPLAKLDTLPDGEAKVEVAAKTKGRHTLVLKSLTGEGGPEYTYRVTLARHAPALTLNADAAGLAVPQGSYQPLPLTVKRTDVPGEVTLTLEGAPPGMKLRTSTIPAGAAELDNVIEVDRSVPLGLYSVRVIATAKAGVQDVSAVATTLPLIDRLPTGHGPHGEPFELREDQRRLPPSLTDRVAVLVVEPSPFTFELPSKLVVLPRYLDAEFPLETTRQAGFDAPIAFEARGGTLEPLMLQKPRVKADLPPATRADPVSIGILRSGVNSEVRRHYVTVTAHAEHDGRGIDLTRRFELTMKPAFEPAADPPKIEVEPGAEVTASIRANRLPPFQGAVTVKPAGVNGWELPESFEIAEGAEKTALKIKVPAGTKPGTYRITLASTARVAKFDESANGKPVEVVVVAPKGGAK
ncbi:MAG: hypothetical protein U0835_21915 [Isosphaeraceae bacterium]